MPDKNEIRAVMKARRKALTPEERKDASEIVCAKLAADSDIGLRVDPLEHELVEFATRADGFSAHVGIPKLGRRRVSFAVGELSFLAAVVFFIWGCCLICHDEYWAVLAVDADADEVCEVDAKGKHEPLFTMLPARYKLPLRLFVESA